ncbi:MAG: putative lipid II flippase FtsW [Candidatus Kerfeldbacteria bacterium]|nr:putative lipid II flippase FtsW [Candidatus Kerfeldbacteria bacterium]
MSRALAVAWRIDYHQWRRWAWPLFMATLIMLVIVFLPGVGSLFLGARRWIKLGPILIQPSEIAKLTFILYLATWLERRSSQLHRVQENLLPFLVTLGIMGGLIIAQPDLGTLTVIMLVAVTMYFLAGAPWKHLVSLFVAGIAAFALVITIAPYRAQRLTVFLNPDIDPQGIGYHIKQAWLAIGSGGFFGLGLGHSRQKFNYLPEPAGDSIFAVTAEELGFFIVSLYILAWISLIIRGLRIARQAPDLFGQLVAAGIICWLGLQAFLNIGALSGILPLTGIPLPFMSQGGSALIVSLAAIGILLNISRQTAREVSR